MKIKVLVTCAAGFIGSNLSEYLIEKGFEVIGLDNFSTGHEKNLINFNGNKNFRFLQRRGVSPRILRVQLHPLLNICIYPTASKNICHIIRTDLQCLKSVCREHSPKISLRRY